MLILSRKVSECIIVDGRIVIKVLRIDRDTVKLGIQAPAEVPVHRQENYDAIQEWAKKEKTAATSATTEPSAPESTAV